MLLGVHCSISGGLINAFKEAETLKINTFQIFTKNQRQWKEKEIEEEEARDFREQQQKQKVITTFSHSSYLINLAAQEAELQKKSRIGITGELKRCEDIGLAFTVLHPGAAKDQPTEEAIERIAAGLKHALQDTKGSNVKIALETMAGQGTTIGSNFEELKAIADLVDSERIAFCFDTCHTFAAGYDIRSRSGIEETLQEWDEIIGLDRLICFHLNDSKGALGSNIDRHTHIGQGEIGDDPFEYIMQEFPEVPKVLETPKVEDWDAKNLDRLRSFV